MNITNNKIAIIGAGLCGSTLAILLQKKGYDVTVYEKQARSISLAKKVRDRSISSSRNGPRSPLPGPAFGTGSNGNASGPRSDYHTKNGRPVPEKDDAVQPYSHNPDENNYSIKRSALNMILIEEAEARKIGINFGAGIDQDVLARLKSEYRLSSALPDWVSIKIPRYGDLPVRLRIAGKTNTNLSISKPQFSQTFLKKNSRINPLMIWRGGRITCISGLSRRTS